MASAHEPGPDRSLRLGPWPAVAALALAMALQGAQPARAAADDPAAKLKAVERDIKANERRSMDMEREAAEAAREVRNLKRELVRLAEKTRGREAAVARLAERIAALGPRVEAAEASLRERRGQMVTMLAALERIARYPPVALAARSGRPVDTVRSALLIRTAVPAIETRSDALRTELAALFSMREELSERRDELVAAARELEAGRARITALVEEKARLERKAEAESAAARARARELGAEAEDLRDLVARLEADRRAASAEPEEDEAPPLQTVALPEAPAAEGGSAATLLTLPVRGRLVHSFGDRLRVGSAAKGMSIEARPEAQVVAPRDGEVVFAGPFRGYGLLLIIRHEDGDYVLLSGMAALYADAGDRVLAGEPVGIMGGGDKPAATTLYVELRRKGRPVNPLPWLTASRAKVSG